MATIKSRCQQYSVYPPSFEQGLTWLQQNAAEASNLDSILTLAKNSPLKALSMMEQDIHVQYMQFCQDMNDLAQGKVHWNEVLTKWKNWQLDYVLQWFYELVLDVQKSQGGVHNLVLKELAGQSQQVAQRANYGQVSQFQGKLLKAQGAQRSQANPNATLLIESLLIDWLKLLRQSS